VLNDIFRLPESRPNHGKIPVLVINPTHFPKHLTNLHYQGPAVLFLFIWRNYYPLWRPI